MWSDRHCLAHSRCWMHRAPAGPRPREGCLIPPAPFKSLLQLPFTLGIWVPDFLSGRSLIAVFFWIPTCHVVGQTREAWPILLLIQLMKAILLPPAEGINLQPVNGRKLSWGTCDFRGRGLCPTESVGPPAQYSPGADFYPAMSTALPSSGEQSRHDPCPHTGYRGGRGAPISTH